MCHPGAVEAEQPEVARSRVRLPLPGGERLPALCCLPHSEHGPAVLVVSDIYGQTPFYEHLTARLASMGYVALLPDLFFRQGPLPEVTRDAAFTRHARLDERGALRDLAASVTWLRELPEVDAPVVGLLGFCLGGTLAIDLCAENSGLAAVCYYAFPLGMTNGNPAPRPVDVAAEVDAPVLAFWGDADYIPLSEVEQLGEAMRAAGVDYEHVVYPGAGHGFLRDLVDQGEAREAAADSWARATEFLARHLPG